MALNSSGPSQFQITTLQSRTLYLDNSLRSRTGRAIGPADRQWEWTDHWANRPTDPSRERRRCLCRSQETPGNSDTVRVSSVYVRGESDLGNCMHLHSAGYLAIT